MNIAAEDLNGDGVMDLVVANYSNGTWTRMDSTVYWGGPKNTNEEVKPGEWVCYPFKGKTDLPSHNAQGVAVGDLNNDGYPDIVLGFSKGFPEYRETTNISPSRVYWNSASGFDPKRYTELETVGATGVGIADFNKDGWLDIAFSNENGADSFVYWGGKDGFSTTRRTALPTAQPQAAVAADVNDDGDMDIVFPNRLLKNSFWREKYANFPMNLRVNFQIHSFFSILLMERGIHLSLT